MARDPELDKVLAEREILRTQYQYSHAVDYSLEEEWLDCFAEDGFYRVGGDVLVEVAREGRLKLADGMLQGQKYRDLRGHEALRAFIKVRAGDARKDTHVMFQKHLPLLPLIDVDGDRATVVSYFIGVDAEDGLPVVRDMGRYRDVFVKCPDGRWRIKERTFEAEAMRRHTH